MKASAVIPMVIDHLGSSERVFDIYSLLLKERIVFLGTGIDDQIANVMVAQLLYLNSQDPKRQIDLYINSPGGTVYGGMAIYDAMQMISAPVATYAVGFTGSMATAILSAGQPGRRYALPQATIHMHPTGGGSKGYTEDVRIATREQERLQAQLFHLMGKHCGHSGEELEKYFLRDRFLNALEARDYGIVDEVLGDTNDLIFLEPAVPEIRYQNPVILGDS
ncbi:MAG: ATP-dependent Clp protease proteolytic subunit [Saprospiraceae bacterium]|nr:ATP-dependent Clp protease proteolytic subunit [Saprospiraceae bacterium]